MRSLKLMASQAGISALSNFVQSSLNVKFARLKTWMSRSKFSSASVHEGSRRSVSCSWASALPKLYRKTSEALLRQ